MATNTIKTFCKETLQQTLTKKQIEYLASDFVNNILNGKIPEDQAHLLEYK